MLKSILGMICMAGAGPALAAGILYDCDITEKRDGLFWISDKIGIVITAAGEVVVSDQVILSFNEAPIKATVTRNTDRKMIIRWKVKDAVDSENQRVGIFDYNAVLDKATNRIKVYANPEGYPNRFNGSGTCSTRNG